MMPMPAITSDAELVELANRLAGEFHRIAHGILTPPGYRYDRAVHPWERSCWRQAVVALAMCRGMDVAEAALNLQLWEHPGNRQRRAGNPYPTSAREVTPTQEVVVDVEVPPKVSAIAPLFAVPYPTEATLVLQDERTETERRVLESAQRRRAAEVHPDRGVGSVPLHPAAARR